MASSYLLASGADSCPMAAPKISRHLQAIFAPLPLSQLLSKQDISVFPLFAPQGGLPYSSPGVFPPLDLGTPREMGAWCVGVCVHSVFNTQLPLCLQCVCSIPLLWFFSSTAPETTKLGGTNHFPSFSRSPFLKAGVAFYEGRSREVNPTPAVA